MGERVGLIYVELDLDYTKFEIGQRTLLDRAKQTSLSVEKNWQILGAKSDVIYQAMANGAINAYNMIANRAKTSAEEQFRAQSAMVARINAINAEMTRNPLYETLGIRSVAAINAQRDAVIASFKTIKASGTATSQDLINIERAKNEKLKALNREMVGDHEMSMASMMRAVLRFYAAYYVATTAIRAVADFVMGGVKAIDDYRVNTVAVAAQLTSMQGTTGNIAKNYKENVVYAEALNRVLMDVDVQSFANYEQIQKMNRAATQHGAVLDVNNKKQLESFTAISNAIALLTADQANANQQAAQEMRALTTGQIKASDQVSQSLDATIKQQGIYKGGLKEVVELSKQNNDLYERLAPYLVGMVAASGDISETWLSVKSSLQTSWGIVQRGLFKGLYKDLTIEGRRLSDWLKRNADDITLSVKNLFETLSFGIKATGALIAGWAVIWAAAMLKAIEWTVSFKAVWETLQLSVIGGASRMAVGFGIFTAAIIGFDIGKLVNQFEWGRIAGIKFVYGLIGSWNWLAKQYEKIVEKLKAGKDLFVDPKNAEKTVKRYYDAIKKIDDDYNAEKEEIRQMAWDQIEANTDKGIAEALRAAQEKAKINIPTIPSPPPGADDAGSKAAKASKDLKKEWEEALQKIKIDTEKTGLNEFEQKLIAIREETEKLIEKFSKISGATKILEDEGGRKITAAISEQEKNDEEAWRKLVNEENEKAINNKKSLALAYRNLQESIDPAKKELREYNENVAMLADIVYTRAVPGIESLDMAVKDLDESIEKTKLEKMAKDIENIYTPQAGATYGDSMAQGLNNAVNAMQRLNREFEIQAESQKRIKKERAEAAGIKDIDARKKKLAEIEEEEQEMVAGQLSAYRNMFGTVSQLFKENSREREVLHKLEMAFALVEIAMSMRKAVVNAAVGATQQATGGDVYTAFARVAAMIALLAGVLSMAGISFGGGGSGGGSASPSPALPRSTVLGAEAGTASESVAKSYELLQDTYKMEYNELRNIYHEMRDLNNNIIGLVTSIIRTGGIAAGTSGIGMGWVRGGIGKGIEDILGTETGKLFNADVHEILMGDTKLAKFFDQSSKVILAVPFMERSFLSSAASKVFGGGVEKSLAASGIRISGSTVANLLAGGGIGSQAYATVSETKEGGWFGSDKTSLYNVYNALNSNVSDMIDLVFRNMGSSLVEIAKALGTDVNAAMQYGFSAAYINLKDMSAEEINKTLSGYFSALGDQAVEALFGPMLRGYQQLNEGLMETAMRLLIDKAIILDMLEKTNRAFSGTIPAAIALSESLIKIAGGLDKLREAAESYYDKFFSDTEKQANLQKQLREILAQYGFALPRDRTGYRDLVESLNLTTEAGKEAYVALMQLSEGADTYYAYLEKARGDVKPEQYATRLEYQRALAMPKFASGGDFYGGYRIVGEAGPEIEYTPPSKIYNKSQVNSLIDNTELIAEIRQLRWEMSEGIFVITNNTRKSATILDRWEGQGLPSDRGY